MAASGAGALMVSTSHCFRLKIVTTLFSSGGRSFKKRSKIKSKSQAIKCIYKPESSDREIYEWLNLKKYCEHAYDMLQSEGGRGGAGELSSPPPRWFSPLECGSRSDKSPLLLYLPGIDGTGFGLVQNHKKLGEIFDVWCLHIPVRNRTPFPDLVNLVVRIVRSENSRLPKRPIYLVGESIGACLALAVAARNPDIDLLLILANPATSFGISSLQATLPLLQMMPQQLNIFLPWLLSLLTGAPLKIVMATLEKGIHVHQSVGQVSEYLSAFSSYLSVMAEILPRETLIWKLQMLASASTYTNSRLHAVKAQTLLLASERDLLLPSQEEGERLSRILPDSEIRRFKDSGHALFLEDDVDLVTIIKGAAFYRHARYIDYISDYIPPTPSEYRKIYETTRHIEEATGPVMLSTLEDDKIVRGLAGVPSEGPVVYVGYHMLLGIELSPMVAAFFIERNIILRGLAHRLVFSRRSTQLDISQFDHFRIMGAVPVSAANFHRLLASNSHVLLYPGGAREALHRRGDEYKLCWPDQSEFVRMAARFGAKIVPFGVVGEDDVSQVILDYSDLLKINNLKSVLEGNEVSPEVVNPELHMPIVLPKVPGRFYYYFGKPIETQGRKEELRSSKKKANELYLEVKSEVEKCISFLKVKREHDPYRSLISRLIFQAVHGSDTQIPTFEL